MQIDLNGKVALITGATSGIGRASALLFAQSGARVAAVGRNEAALATLSGDINALHGEAITLQADVTVDAPRILDETLARFGSLDVLVNAAGHLANGTIESTTLESWDSMLDINLRAVFQLMQLATPYLEKTRGNVVNVSSVTGLRSFPGVLAYCVSKAGLDQLTRCAALELASKGIRVNAVNPGVVVTEIH
jgi:NAD(P)-dependent dehydrogenase (short-subunit alcohol dehydrogenase family)